MKHNPPHIHVACAIIERAGLTLAARRSEEMSLPLKWEFPGGKIDTGESGKDCLMRELQEEMGIQITVGRFIGSFTHGYPSLKVTLYPFICRIISGEIILHEHAEITWLRPEDLPALDWAEEDIPVVQEYLAHHQCSMINPACLPVSPSSRR
jgi:8-oxo-dGTP diphosphatase